VTGSALEGGDRANKLSYKKKSFIQNKLCENIVLYLSCGKETESNNSRFYLVFRKVILTFISLSSHT
jgi:hypothetical protein